MRIETTSTEYIIRLDRAAFTSDEIERLIRTLRLNELSGRLKGTAQEADQLADELMENWWSHRTDGSFTPPNA